ncbi:jg342 [Pararge aegeria aegeria]|uniref:Jg342 protein n=1 Tax=Pararge aegeria aegeria TaxID=348720 RepID=A0A8S4QWQ8_9NEOP|nr:jg342 [Pararge aegeria aegeria]
MKNMIIQTRNTTPCGKNHRQVRVHELASENRLKKVRNAARRRQQRGAARGAGAAPHAGATRAHALPAATAPRHRPPPPHTQAADAGWLLLAGVIF